MPNKFLAIFTGLLVVFTAAAYGSSDIAMSVGDRPDAAMTVSDKAVHTEGQGEIVLDLPVDQTISEEEHDYYDAMMIRALQNGEMKTPSELSGVQILAEAKTDSVKEEPLKENSGIVKGNSEDSEDNGISDPLYFWNAAMFHLNDKFYFWFMKPLSQAYSAVVPETARIGVSNFFHNITTPVRFLGSLMQFKLKNAADELVRFVTNTTQGAGGLMDVAKSHYGLTTTEEDIGQALGRYGIGHGIYIVWPFIGASSLRDSVGLAGGVLLDPVTYVNPLESSAGINLFDKVNETTFRIGDYETMKESAVDPYVSMRNGYMQKRRHQVRE